MHIRNEYILGPVDTVLYHLARVDTVLYHL
jgi:hypothetical protein